MIKITEIEESILWLLFSLLSFRGGEYIGHTAQKTREQIRKAMGGILFIDEAYSLTRGGEKDFGREAIDCLVKTRV
jgi:hypothetical protein